LDVDEAVGGVHLAVEHAAEFEIADALLQTGDIGFDRFQGFFVVFRAGQFEQLAGIVQAAADLVQVDDYAFQFLAFAAEFLGALGVIPDFRVFQQAGDFGQAIMFARVVKDTPVARRRGAPGRPGWCRSD
jgi:hypothetical protein